MEGVRGGVIDCSDVLVKGEEEGGGGGGGRFLTVEPL